MNNDPSKEGMKLTQDEFVYLMATAPPEKGVRVRTKSVECLFGVAGVGGKTPDQQWAVDLVNQWRSNAVTDNQEKT